MDDFGQWEERLSLAEIASSIARIAGLVAIAYVVLCFLVYFRQASYMYYPDKKVGLTPDYFKVRYDNVKLKTRDGETIAAWLVPAESDQAVIFCHGNAGNISHRLDSIAMFHNMGYNVLIFDYRGYGESSGKPTEQGTYQDALAAWDYLTRARKVRAVDIALYGESLGGAVATWLAERVHPGALVLDSTFTSAPDMARKMFPFLPIRLLCKFQYDSISRIGKAGCPVLIAHSRKDEMIPFACGKRLFEAAKQPKQFVEMAGLHNDGGIMSDTNHIKVVEEFLAKHLGRSASEREK
jgi:uncharacterized protein